ncbi:MAG: hypothetical protein LUI87_14875 [Lachnospiraceae bacterium]|nr:hypothetical protein [Lachnospiraceae bacterium]
MLTIKDNIDTIMQKYYMTEDHMAVPEMAMLRKELKEGRKEAGKEGKEMLDNGAKVE